MNEEIKLCLDVASVLWDISLSSSDVSQWVQLRRSSLSPLKGRSAPLWCFYRHGPSPIHPPSVAARLNSVCKPGVVIKSSSLVTFPPFFTHSSSSPFFPPSVLLVSLHPPFPPSYPHPPSLIPTLIHSSSSPSFPHPFILFSAQPHSFIRSSLHPLLPLSTLIPFSLLSLHPLLTPFPPSSSSLVPTHIFIFLSIHLSSLLPLLCPLLLHIHIPSSPSLRLSLHLSIQYIISVKPLNDTLW